MRNSLFLIPILLCIVSCTQKTSKHTVNFNQIKIHNNLFYYQNEETPYTGKCELFYQNGNKSKELSIRDGKYNGPTLSFYENGQKSNETKYTQGILDGRRSSWYLNGQKRIESTYKAGKLTGDFIKWDYKGNKVFEKDYTLGEYKVNGKINISSEQDVIAIREGLIKHIWGRNVLPADRFIDSIETNIVFTTEDRKSPYLALYNSTGNLKQIDRYKICLPNSFVSNVYHFHPIISINKAFFYHAGHSPGGFHAEDCTNNNGIEPGLVIPRLIKEGYDVVVFMMPLAGNDLPIVEFDNNVGKISFPFGSPGHDLMFDYLKNPYRYFIEDMLATMNYIEMNYKFDDIYLMGLSGGGWTTTLYAALDPRIKLSFPVAGTMPGYLRHDGDIGDAEQGDYYGESDPDGLYSIANYEELYVLGSYGENRRQIQILNEFDDCCFSGKRYPYWIDDVKAVLKKLGKGEYNFYLEQDTKTHKVSEIAMDIILSSIKDCKLEMINEPPITAVAGKRYSFKPEIKQTKACKPVKNLVFSLIIRPTWLSIDSISGVLTGKPSQANIGDTLYSYKTIDDFGGFIIRDVRLKVVKEQ
jgi:hypothetical protein